LKDWTSAFARKVNDDTVLIGLLGSGIGASRTPGMHMAEGRAMGLPIEYRLIDTDGSEAPIDLEAVLRQLEDLGFTGINVTFPYKQAVIPLLTSIADSAAAVGAVNTILFRNGTRLGENTDYWGFRESLRTGLPGVAMENILLVGAGGAGAAVASALIDEGCGHLHVLDADETRAAALVDRLGGPASVVVDMADVASRVDGIVNATPVGMDKLPGLPIPAEMISPRHWVADIIYFRSRPLCCPMPEAWDARSCRDRAWRSTRRSVPSNFSPARSRSRSGCGPPSRPSAVTRDLDFNGRKP